MKYNNYKRSRKETTICNFIDYSGRLKYLFESKILRYLVYLNIVKIKINNI